MKNKNLDKKLINWFENYSKVHKDEIIDFVEKTCHGWFYILSESKTLGDVLNNMDEENKINAINNILKTTNLVATEKEAILHYGPIYNNLKKLNINSKDITTELIAEQYILKFENAENAIKEQENYIGNYVLMNKFEKKIFEITLGINDINSKLSFIYKGAFKESKMYNLKLNEFKNAEKKIYEK